METGHSAHRVRADQRSPSTLAFSNTLGDHLPFLPKPINLPTRISEERGMKPEHPEKTCKVTQ